MIVDKNTKHFLIINRRDFYTKKYDWRLVKGGIELSESQVAALKREIMEEVGLLNVKIDRKIHDYSFVYSSGYKASVSVFLVYSDESEKTIPSEEEKIREIKWVTASRAISMLKYNEEKDAVKKTSEILTQDIIPSS